MPWRTATVPNERARFVLEAQETFLSFSELCRRYGISRRTGYKWLSRFDGNLDNLADRSRRPSGCSHATAPEVVERVLQLRRSRGWGARKLRRLLRDELEHVPSVDTIHRILQRHDLVDRPRKPRRRRGDPLMRTTPSHEPNAVWTADFKGEFRTVDGQLCYPLTVQDGFSRFLLDCKGFPNLQTAPVIRRFDYLFRTFGMPDVIRTDNGHPFCSPVGLGGLSQLSVHWIKLGIRPERIDRGKPQQNGRHERMHRTLKARTTRPAGQNLRCQQRRFNRFRQIFNHERPHEALDLETPASCYRSSDRSRPAIAKTPQYPDHFEVRKVAQDKTIRWKNRKVCVSQLLRYEYIGLEEIAEEVWSVFYGPVQLGWLDERDFRIMDTLGAQRYR